MHKLTQTLTHSRIAKGMVNRRPSHFFILLDVVDLQLYSSSSSLFAMGFAQLQPTDTGQTNSQPAKASQIQVTSVWLHYNYPQ